MAQPWQQYGGPAAAAHADGPSSLAWGSPAAGGDDDYGRLRSVEDLPPAFRPVFSGSFRYFNAIQSECFRDVAESSMNIVLAAPTGSGKTVVLELAVLQLLSRNIDETGTYRHQHGCLKAVYLAPARALVQEKTREWTERFGKNLGVTVKEVTGDTDISDLDGLDATDIICTTPEKFDAMTRRHRANGGMRFFNEIALVLIDEVHLLNESRGSSLEAGVISRIKMVSQLREMRENPIAKVRFVAVSATIPNTKDIADWLGVPPQGIKTFGEEMRPVKLRTVVRGYNPTKTDFLFERRLNDHISGVVADFSKGRPTLVFCSSRKGTSETAQHVAKDAVQRAAGGRPSIYIRDVAHNQRLLQATADLKNAQLKECIKAGVGFHHAALDPAERALVEKLFLSMDILVLCTTSTLAMGVNLPAHLVVIKGTRRYIGAEAEDSSGYQEYECSTCLQMVGRAGRPQFDTEGIAVIMTQKQHVARYEQLVTGSETVESALKDMLPEFLNAEIALRTITDVSMAINWIKGTFFYTRVLRNPVHYEVPRQLLQSQEALDSWVKEKLVLATIQELSRHGLVRTDEDGFVVEPRQPGIIMAEQYIRMRTMILMANSPSGATIPDLITIVARSTELSNIKLRRSEKKQLNELNHGDAVRYHLMNPAKAGKVMERISSADHKIFILVNTALSDRPVDKLEYSLRQEMDQLVSVGARITGAMIKYFQHVERAAETFNSYLLHKNFKQRMWTDSQYETRQLPGIGPLISERLAAAGINKLQQLIEVDPRRLESITQRHYPFGNEVHDALRNKLPPVMELQIAPLGRSGAAVEMEVTVTRVGGTGNPALKSRACLLVGTLPSNRLLACRALCLETFPSPTTLRLRTVIPKGSVAPLSVVASVVHERLVGMDVAVSAQIPLNAYLGGQQQRQAGGVAPTPTSVCDVQPDHSTSSGDDGMQGMLAEEQPEGVGTAEIAARPSLQSDSAAVAAAGSRLAFLQTGWLQPKPLSEARQFMQQQQQQSKTGPNISVEVASITMPTPLPRPALGGPSHAAAAAVEGPARVALGSQQGMGGPSIIAGVASSLLVPSHSAALEPLRPQLGNSAGGSKWHIFLKPSMGSSPVVAPRQSRPTAAAGAWGPKAAPAPQAAAAPALRTHEKIAVQQKAIQKDQEQQPTMLPAQLLPSQQQRQQSTGIQGRMAFQAGQLFSSFRSNKPVVTRRPAQELLLAKLAGKQPGITAPQQAPAWRPDASIPFNQPPQLQACQATLPAAAPAAMTISAGPLEQGAAPLPRACLSPAIGLPQKRKLQPSLGRDTEAERHTTAAAAMPGLPITAAPSQRQQASATMPKPDEQPAKSTFRLPVLPFISSSRWRRIEAAVGPTGGMPGEGKAAQHMTALPQLDVSQAFAFL